MLSTLRSGSVTERPDMRSPVLRCAQFVLSAQLFRRSRPLRPRSIHDGLIHVSTMEDWGGALSHGAATCPGEAGEPFRSRLSIGLAPPRQHRAGPRFPQCVCVASLFACRATRTSSQLIAAMSVPSASLTHTRSIASHQVPRALAGGSNKRRQGIPRGTSLERCGQVDTLTSRTTCDRLSESTSR
jgi:hypothetical protein